MEINIFDNKSLILISSAILNLAVFFYLTFSKSRNVIKSKYYLSFATLCTVIWMLSSWFNHFLPDLSLVTFFSRLSYSAVLGIVFGIFLFALNFNKPTKVTIPFGIFFLLVILFTQFTPFVVSEGVLSTAISEENVVFGSYYIIWSIIVGIIALSLIGTLIFTIKKSIGIKRGKITTIVALFLVTIFLTLFCNLILPNLGITSFIIVGQYSTFFFAMGSSWIVLQEKIFSMRYLFAMIVTTLVSGLLLYLMSWGTQKFEQYAFKWDISQLFEPKILIFGIFVGSIVAVLLEKTLPSIKRTTLKLFKVNVVTLQFTYEWLISKSNEKVDITIYITELLNKLENSLGCKNVALYIKDFDVIYNSEEKYKFTKSSLEKYKDIATMHIIENVENPIALVMPLTIEGTISGLLIFGNKNNSGYYSIEEIRNIEKILTILTIAVNRYTLYKQQEKFAQILQKEIAAATKELKTKNELLTEKSQQEHDMLDILGHELRTPLSIVRNAIDFMIGLEKKGDLSNTKLNKYLTMSQENIYREVNLLEIMLSSTKIDNNKLNLILEKVDLDDVVEDSLLGLKEKAKIKNINLSFKNLENSFVTADRTRIQEVADNLIENAIKYTNEGSVVVTIESIDKYYCLTVKDTGIGIAEKDLENIGKKFFRANNYLESSQNKNHISVIRAGGTGLGLYVTLNLVKAMGGKIEIKSELNKGSEFKAYFLKFAEK